MKSIVTPLPSVPSAMARARSERKMNDALEHADQVHAVGMIAPDLGGERAHARLQVVGGDERLHVVQRAPHKSNIAASP